MPFYVIIVVWKSVHRGFVVRAYLKKILTFFDCYTKVLSSTLWHSTQQICPLCQHCNILDLTVENDWKYPKRSTQNGKNHISSTGKRKWPENMTWDTCVVLTIRGKSAPQFGFRLLFCAKHSLDDVVGWSALSPDLSTCEFFFRSSLEIRFSKYHSHTIDDHRCNQNALECIRSRVSLKKSRPYQSKRAGNHSKTSEMAYSNAMLPTAAILKMSQNL